MSKSFFRRIVDDGATRARSFRHHPVLTASLLALLGGSAGAQSHPSSETWCGNGSAGPASALPAPVAMSAAHAQARFFGAGPNYVDTDLSLAAALEGLTVDWDAATTSYADMMESVCALDVSSQSLAPARVLALGPIAFVRPGTGPLTLPRHTRAVVIDLRNLPQDPRLEEALARAIGVASTAPVTRLTERVRGHLGMMDEMSYYNVYRNFIDARTPAPHAATGHAQLPVALLTGPALAPAAARFAVDLRMAQRAWLVGAPVHTSVAESRWMPVSARGLLIRTSRLEDSQGPIPDVLAPDLSLSILGLSGATTDLPTSARASSLTSLLGTPAPVDRTAPVVRKAPSERIPFEDTPPPGASSGIARADLLILHGATRLFFPYFHVVGDGIDARLMETLALVDATPVTQSSQTHRLLQRFNEVLKDGHGFVDDWNSDAPAGYFPVALEEVSGEPVIRRSALPDVHPGDTVVSVGGTPMSAWLAEEKAHASAATPGYLHNVVVRRLLPLKGPTTFGLRAVDGTVRSVQVQPQPVAALRQVSGPASLRGAGSLADLGAPELHYLNLASEVLNTPAAFLTALTGAQGAQGLVVDMRGYPGVSNYQIAERLVPAPFQSPIFRYPVWTGPDAFEMFDSIHTRQPQSNPSYAGPIVLLVGPGTVSAAENFSIMLKGAQRVTVVGRRSAGTNGNITYLLLPGLMSACFTSMEVLHQNRERFHGIGIVPDIEVAPTASDIATGRDPELLRAIEYLRTGQ
ncbi:S41 family peptidase [Myxococcus qinghaiensis]|uniref:S41 family peptidase n=1 Tax=Myxococcus qinghaiensis TaxID=2906758 RepID=UPI0020A73B5E|nr:S41 family peptidase [Myxococcus qinghaiensis]MCP3165682.1 S41 family peptidase [Myxococcus qinghaiensis]